MIKVLHTVVVPAANHCWNGLDSEICQYFDNDGGTPYCMLFNDILKYNSSGVPKLAECLKMLSAEASITTKL